MSGKQSILIRHVLSCQIWVFVVCSSPYVRKIRVRRNGNERHALGQYEKMYMCAQGNLRTTCT